MCMRTTLYTARAVRQMCGSLDVEVELHGGIAEIHIRGCRKGVADISNICHTASTKMVEAKSSTKFQYTLLRDCIRNDYYSIYLIKRR